MFSASVIHICCRNVLNICHTHICCRNVLSICHPSYSPRSTDQKIITVPRASPLVQWGPFSLTPLVWTPRSSLSHTPLVWIPNPFSLTHRLCGTSLHCKISTLRLHLLSSLNANPVSNSFLLNLPSSSPPPSLFWDSAEQAQKLFFCVWAFLQNWWPSGRTYA